ncbi:MAG: DUF3656 domain-containing protein [Lentisphaerae bacterium]|nr:DUF3656 domain-containing protein [Lentisphaerota bacterium]
MKDLALPDELPALRKAGVSAVKIEGRMKSPLYVAVTVNLYRRLMDGPLTADERRNMESDIQSVFSRPWTRLYVHSRRNRQIVDPWMLGHRGTRIGQVTGIPSGSQTTIRFQTSRALERHDGLQLEIPGEPKPYGFAVTQLRILKALTDRSGENMFRAEPGAFVEVLLPPDHPRIPDGTPVFCSSSQEVKQHYGFSKPKPGQFKVRKPVEILLTLSEREIRLKASIMAKEDGRDHAFGLASGARPSNYRADAPSVFRPGQSPELPVEIEICQPGEFQKARQPAEVEAAIRSAFEKLGDTRLALARLTVANPDGLFMPISQCNALRRRMAETLQAALDQASKNRLTTLLDRISRDLCGRARPPAALGAQLLRAGESVDSSPALGPDAVPFSKPDEDTGDTPNTVLWSIKVDRIASLSGLSPDDWRRLQEAIVDIGSDPIETLQEALRPFADNRDGIRLALPLILRGWEMPELAGKIAALIKDGWRRWQVSNLYGLPLLSAKNKLFLPLPLGEGRGEGCGRQPALDITADWPLYVTNRSAGRQLERLGLRAFTLSPEDGLANMAEILAAFDRRATVIVYQDTPLMISETCPFLDFPETCKAEGGCRNPATELQNRFGDRLQVINRACRSVLINRKPYCIASRLDELQRAGARSFRADFLYRRYEPDEAVRLWRKIRQGESIPGGHEGNISRGLA